MKTLIKIVFIIVVLPVIAVNFIYVLFSHYFTLRYSFTYFLGMWYYNATTYGLITLLKIDQLSLKLKIK
jgi:hypothetical protein